MSQEQFKKFINPKNNAAIKEKFKQEKKIAKKDVLSDRENEVLQLLADGLLYKEIADRLYIGHGTVRQHLHNIYEKLHVHNRTEAVNKYFDRS